MVWITHEEVESPRCPYCDSYDIGVMLSGTIVNNKLCNVWYCNACNNTFEEFDDVED